MGPYLNLPEAAVVQRARTETDHHDRTGAVRRRAPFREGVVGAVGGRQPERPAVAVKRSGLAVVGGEDDRVSLTPAHPNPHRGGADVPAARQRQETVAN